MIEEYKLQKKIEYEFSNKTVNLSAILSLMSIFIIRFKKNIYALRYLNKVATQIKSLSAFVEILKNNDIIKLIEYCERNHLYKLSKNLCLMLSINPKLKLRQIRKLDSFTWYFSFSKIKPQFKKEFSTPLVILQLYVNAEILRHIEKLYKSCFENQEANQDLYQIINEDAQQKVINFLKPRLFTFNTLILIGLGAFIFSYLAIALSLKQNGLSSIINYIDILPLVLRMKIMTIAILVIVSVIVIIYSTPINEYLLQEKYENNDTRFTVLFLMKYIISMFGGYWASKFSEKWEILFFFIAAGILFIVTTFVEYRYYKQSKVGIKRYPIIFTSQLLFTLYAFCIFIFTLPIGLYFDRHFLLAGGCIYSILIIIHYVEIRGNTDTLIKIIGRLYLLFLMIFSIISLFYMNVNTLEFLDAAYKPGTLGLINIEIDSENLANKLRANGITESISDSKNIYNNKMEFESFILNYKFPEVEKICSTLVQREILSSIYLAIESNTKSDTLKDAFQDQKKCISSYNHIGSTEYSKYFWKNTYFTVYKESEDKYNYWIYGVNIPFYIQNKILVIKIPNSDFQYILVRENGLKYFEIDSTFEFNKDIESNIKQLKKKFYMVY